jgi:rhodanese-related sulfurtransferase
MENIISIPRSEEDCLQYLEGNDKQATSCDDARALIQNGAKLYDIRAKADVKDMLPGSVNIDTNEAYDDVIKVFGEKKDKEIVLYCYSGNKACNLRNHLIREGYSKVYNIGGYESKKEVCERLK